MVIKKLRETKWYATDMSFSFSFYEFPNITHSMQFLKPADDAELHQHYIKKIWITTSLLKN